KKINDGKWHHVIAEADRSAKELTIYIDGKRDSSGSGIGSASINNDSDLFVCGTSNGKYLKGTVEFIRISLGTLKDAKTDIKELYAWQFDGPFLRDFAGSKPKGKRDAGALELID
ncbi:MAG TPA: LamG-like jellyroll fold domain-containing protein, partial [Sedimentisphaerales bacterium]|nr:LamG-like jellyroll fold domain-containing protein [Sedimentisphaerales bacterium]